MGDFNCVPDIALDTRRVAQSPYKNGGADILTFIALSNSLQDQMRIQLGNSFNFTRSETSPSGAYCNTRIDRHYLPQIQHHIWESEITPLLIVESDHIAVKSTLTDTRSGPLGIKYGNDVITINARVFEEDQNRADLEKIIDSGAHQIETCCPGQITKLINKMKQEIRSSMRRMTNSH
eukprot:1823390-Pleurochrysis_carterae.AAC.1